MKKAKIRLLALAFLVFFLSGCGTLEVKSQQGLEGASAEAGLIILSAGSTGTSISTSTFINIYKRVDEKPDFNAMGASFSLNGSLIKSHFSDHHGTVLWRFLPPGKYVAIPIIANPYAYYTNPPQASFEIKASETLYIGEFWLERGRFLIRDAYERDISYFGQSNPNFPLGLISRRIPSFVKP